jgi:large subunit ribosomal protein L10
MNKEQKTQLVSSLQGSILKSVCVVVIHYRGMTDKQLYDLRVDLKSKGCGIKISKNTLIKVALKNTHLENLFPYLNGPTAILVSQDPVLLSKIISDASKKIEVIKIIAGYFNNAIITESTIKEMAKLGSINDVRSSFIGLLKATQSKFVRVLNAPSEGLATLKTQ